MLTRCPHCQATFQVTSQQLEVASGKVRCGACMKVFDAVAAAKSMSGPAPAVAEKPDTPAPKPAASKPAESYDETELVFTDDPEEDSKEGRYSGKADKKSAIDLSDSFLSLDEDSSRSPGKVAFISDDDHEQVDESWAEEILEGSARKPASAPASKPVATPSAAVAPEMLGALTPPSHVYGASTAAVNARRDEPPMRAEPDHYSTRPSVPQRTAPPPPRTPTATSPYTNLRAAPIALQRHSSGALRKALLFILAIVLLGALGAQFLWFERDQYSQVPQLRPYYTMLCDVAGCTLPPLIALDLIQSEKLVVRSHPEQKRALIVDANIVNRARFPQPLPAIALTFSNLSEQVVAQRLFQPEEYLAGEGTSLAYMPVDTPIRISLEVKDPGRDAVNYTIRFFPARNNRSGE